MAHDQTPARSGGSGVALRVGVSGSRSLLWLWHVRVLVGVWQVAVGRCRVGRDVGLWDLVEDQLTRTSFYLRAAAEIACGNSGVANRVDGVVGVKFSARTAVRVHIREDADDSRVSCIDKDGAGF